MCLWDALEGRRAVLHGKNVLAAGDERLVKARAKPPWIATVDNKTEECPDLLRIQADRKKTEAEGAHCGQASRDVLGYGDWQPATLDEQQEMLMHTAYIHPGHE